ncbi:hypothetical protein RFI_30270 [Reticulomyxa filosa]|uniref:Uncharacterized protein n=1 Tax=Reticulomyxa filosa TaxID=46433 RepID=X6M0H4_RETFI|nr:hypothetical protein RFI_30270 [Reticulomyxa filosa]|eukprot:ETO07121.1 hypothetical protein RFI_30270 [Reticulomyxa filosa]
MMDSNVSTDKLNIWLNHRAEQMDALRELNERLKHNELACRSVFVNSSNLFALNGLYFYIRQVFALIQNCNKEMVGYSIVFVNQFYAITGNDINFFMFNVMLHIQLRLLHFGHCTNVSSFYEIDKNKLVVGKDWNRSNNVKKKYSGKSAPILTPACQLENLNPSLYINRYIKSDLFFCFVDWLTTITYLNQSKRVSLCQYPFPLSYCFVSFQRPRTYQTKKAPISNMVTVKTIKIERSEVFEANVRISSTTETVYEQRKT